MRCEHAEFIAAAHALDEAFVRHANPGDPAQLVAACYVDDALVLPPNAPLVRGRIQIRELFGEMMEAGAGDVAREATLLYADGDLGYGIGNYTFAIHHEGTLPVSKAGKHLSVHRRQGDGTWKVAADMFSSNLPER
jgi:ketosteroid isomerase-like protein